VPSETLIACPECGAVVAPDQLDRHLLKTHRSYQFRGIVRPVHDTLAALLSLVCSPWPDAEAWRALESIAVHECGSNVDAFLATSLTEALKRLEGEKCDAAVASIAAVIARHSARTGLLLPRLAASPESMARRLAVTLMVQTPALLVGAPFSAMRPLLLDRTLALELQTVFAIELISVAKLDAREVTEALIADLPTGQAAGTLRQLEKRLGPHAVLGQIRAQVEERVRLRCSRCGAELGRKEMIDHLWTNHALVLDGRRARDPWEVIEDWIAYYRRSGDAGLLNRCRLLAQRLNPESGLARVQRLMLTRGVIDLDARANLLAEAAEKQASLCPRCYALVPLPRPDPPAELSIAHGRLSARGYRVEVSQAGLLPWLEIETPVSRPIRSPLPGPRLTRKGFVLLLMGPLVLAALLVALAPFDLGVPRVLPVLLLLLPAVGIYAWIRGKGAAMAANDQAVDHTWIDVTPLMHNDGFSLNESAVLAGLARASLTLGRPVVRERVLEQVLTATEQAVVSNPAALHHLAALHGLAIADAVEGGGDPVELLAAQLGRCFEGKLPLAFGEQLLAGCRSDWRTRANLARLRVLLLDRAFETGFEVANLLAAGQSAPILGNMLGTADPGGLARLRLLWSLRPRQPWDRCGECETAFTLAATVEGGAVLGRYPDLLLYQAGSSSSDHRPGMPRRLEIIICGRGIAVEDTLFTEPVRTIDVQTKRVAAGERHVLTLGEHRFVFRGDADEVVRQVDQWFRYYFNEFVAQTMEVYRWRSPHVAAILRAWGTVPCPECQRTLVARAGEVGIALEPAGDRGH
jgi:hypothetical protein